MSVYRTLALLVASLLMSGCNDMPTSDGSLPSGTKLPDIGANATAHLRSEGKGQFTFSDINTPANVGYESGGSCRGADEAEVSRVFAGWVNASWTPRPGSERLRLVMGSNDLEERIEVEGSSPLHLKVSPLNVTRTFVFGLEAINVADAAAVVEQTFDLAWDFTYEGKPDVKFWNASC